MRESPVITLLKMFWWLPLLIGLGMLAFGSLVKTGYAFGASPEKLAFAQSMQVFSIIFIGLSVVSFLICFSQEFLGKWVQMPDAGTPEAQKPPPPAPQPAPPPRKKYSDRDFMPPALRAELDANEGKPGHVRLQELTLPQTLNGGDQV